MRLISTSVKERGGAKSYQEMALASAAREERVTPGREGGTEETLVLQGEDRKENWERKSRGGEQQGGLRRNGGDLCDALIPSLL